MVLTINFPQRRNPTNGEILQALFPDIKIITHYVDPHGKEFVAYTLNNKDQQVNLEWWNAPYSVKENRYGK